MKRKIISIITVLCILTGFIAAMAVGVSANAPAVPKNLNYVGFATTISWSIVDGAGSYKLYIYTVDDAGNTTEVYGATISDNYLDISKVLTASGNYLFQVASVSTDGKYSSSYATSTVFYYEHTVTTPEQQEYSVNVSLSGEIPLGVTGDGVYTEGDTVTITVAPFGDDEPCRIHWLSNDSSLELPDESVNLVYSVTFTMPANDVDITAHAYDHDVYIAVSDDGAAIEKCGYCDYCRVLSPAVIIGDINGDGIVNATDLSVLRKIVKGVTVETTDGADLNDDGSVNVTDLSILQRKLKGGS